MWSRCIIMKRMLCKLLKAYPGLARTCMFKRGLACESHDVGTGGRAETGAG